MENKVMRKIVLAILASVAVSLGLGFSTLSIIGDGGHVTPRSIIGDVHTTAHHHRYRVQPGGPIILAQSPNSIIGDVHLMSKRIPMIDPQSADEAGFIEGRWTRQMDVTFTLPSSTACAETYAPRATGPGWAVTLGNSEQATTGTPLSTGPAVALGVSMSPTAAGCNGYFPSFEGNITGTTAGYDFPAITLNPGDNITLELGYSQGGQVTWANVTDNTTGDSSHATVSGKETYIGGSVTSGFCAPGCGPGTKYTPQGGRTKLMAFKNADMATYTGHVGPVGSFRPQEVTLTSNALSTGTLYVNPGKLWNSDQNFSVFGH